LYAKKRKKQACFLKNKGYYIFVRKNYLTRGKNIKIFLKIKTKLFYICFLEDHRYETPIYILKKGIMKLQTIIRATEESKVVVERLV
jgi:hypothetical protein